MNRFLNLTSRVVALPVDNVDTDQIIPARFLKTISKEGLDKQLFYDWRYDAEGNPKPDFVLNRPEVQGREVLLAGDNFGCGSSREHAPWALTQFGFGAIISTSFADIFRQNALKNSLLPIVVSREVHGKLFQSISADPNATVRIDLQAQRLTLPDGSAVEFPVEAFSKHCLLEGVDEMGFLLEHEPQIGAYEAQRLGSVNTLAR